MSTSTGEFSVPVTQIDPAERARRTAAVQSATGHLRMEGLYASPLALALKQRYIETAEMEWMINKSANELCSHEN
jgi:hypothetical protein